MPRIPLVVRLPNHLGDVCMALPALEALAAAGYALHLAGRGWATELLAAYPWPVLALPTERGSRVRALRALARTLGPRCAALLLTNSFSSALEFRLAGLRATGYARDGRSLLLAHAVPVPAAWYSALHTRDYYRQLAQEMQSGRWGAPAIAAPAKTAPADAAHSDPVHPGLRLNDQQHARARAARAQAGLGPRYVVLCPVAVGRHQGQDKCWQGFGRLCTELQTRGLDVGICPGPGEREAAARATPTARLIGPLDVGAFAALLAGSALVVANDSGPGHLAAAVGARLVGVFGVTDPAKTQPLGAQVRILGGLQGWPAYDAVLAAVGSALADASPAPAA